MSLFGVPGVINAIWLVCGGFLVSFGWAAGNWLWAKLITR